MDYSLNELNNRLPKLIVIMKTNPQDQVTGFFSPESGTIQGLTKREYFAGLAMQALSSDPNRSMFSWESAAQEAVSISDALIKELNK